MSLEPKTLRLFVRTAELGAIGRAGAQLGYSSTHASHLLKSLEEHLGASLFHRTTRTVSLTGDGTVFLDHARRVLAAIERAEHALQPKNAALRGTIRLAAPADTTQKIVADALAAFSTSHRMVRVIIYPTDVLQNVQQDALDISIRFGNLNDSTLIARKLAQSPRVLVASPSYLAENGVPTTPQDLNNHRLLTLQVGNKPEKSWSIRCNASITNIDTNSPLCGNGLVVRRWAVAGHGIALKSLFDVFDDLQAGRLVRVLPEADGGIGPIHAVYPSRRHVPARVTALLELLAERFSERSAQCDAWLTARVDAQSTTPGLPYS